MPFSLADLEAVIRQRLDGDPESSYVAQLHSKGLDKILEKVGEETTEAIIAAKNYAAEGQLGKQPLIGEVADLWFHSLVMLSHLGISQCDIMRELEGRLGQSGLEEKASRNQ